MVVDDCSEAGRCPTCPSLSVWIRYGKRTVHVRGTTVDNMRGFRFVQPSGCHAPESQLHLVECPILRA
eukprot:5700856-Prymnesium_polylepis.1